MEIVPTPPVHRVLCADCGTPIEPNSANLCLACLRNSVDITEGIPKQATVSFCKNCERFLSPPQTWTIAEPESRELLAICLKKLKGLNKVRLVDAGFVWTEPHSKRIKVKLTVQKEVLTSTILQQIFQVEYVVQHTQCPDCAKLAAKNTWKALVQVRQKVQHKRTFLFLEQLILKHGAQRETISVKEVRDGLDFFYSQRSHAIRMVEFLGGVVPTKTKSSEQLLSTDTHSGTSSYKFTYSVELSPICKDDLVALPLSLAQSLSNISPLVLCTRVGSSIHLLDFQGASSGGSGEMRGVDVIANVYWRSPFDSLATTVDMVEFTVLDVEPIGPAGPKRSKWVLADAQVAVNAAFKSSNTSKRSRNARNGEDDGMDFDFDPSGGGANQIYHTRTHLGGILSPGDTVLGYHLSHTNFNSDNFSALLDNPSLASRVVPDVVLVRKTYPNRRKKNKARNWRLKSMAKEEGEGEGDDGRGPGRREGVIGRMGGRDQKKVEEDYELFLRDIEEDDEMRAAVNLYKRPTGSTVNTQQPPSGLDVNGEHDVKMGAGSGLAGGKSRRKAKKAAKKDGEEGMEVDGDVSTPAQPTGIEEDSDGDNEADFPEVKLDELLDEFDELTLGEGEQA